DPIVIYELKIKICRHCIVDALISRQQFEKNYLSKSADRTYKEKTIKAIYFVDFMQLRGSYLSFDLWYSSSSSHVLFFFEKDIERFVNELSQIKDDDVYNWLQEKGKVVHQYQKNILIAKYPLINDKNIEMMLDRSSFY
ncbi:20467_t:CDS:2, partial [Racocetra persica]